MRPPRTADEYRDFMLEYGSRTYTKTIFQGYIYRFVVELLREDDSVLPKRFPDLDDYALAQSITYQSKAQAVQFESKQLTFSQLEDIRDSPYPSKGEGQVLFLFGHLPGSWISTVGAKFGIAPEFFRRHVHLWRSSEGSVFYSVPRLPSTRKGLALRINAQGLSARPFGGISLTERRKLLPEGYQTNPSSLALPPGSSYVRGHAILSDHHFMIEQDISITIEHEGSGWTAILWSDVGQRDLSKSVESYPFIKHLAACSKTGFRSIRLIPATIVGVDSELRHDLPPLNRTEALSPRREDDSLVQSATHLASECHLLVDHSIAARDPIYAISPVFKFAAATENEALDILRKRYEIISSTIWDPKQSTDFLEQLILQKHILDDHAGRHLEVLQFLRSPVFRGSMQTLSADQGRTAREAREAVVEDYEYLLNEYRQLSVHHQEAISVLVSSVALVESKKQITLATQVTKLTVLATVFLPLSYCASIFGMNFVELDNLSIWIWAVVTFGVGVATIIVYQWDEKHLFGQKCEKKLDQMLRKLRVVSKKEFVDPPVV